MRRGHIPLRSCIGCGLTTNKQDMVRIVRAAIGTVEIDLTGKKPGRGAYLCSRSSCWEAVLKGNRLEHALRGNIPVEGHQALVDFALNLVEKS